MALRAEQLARLAYELLDANGDTERLVYKCPTELEWRAHLSYLRDLQRIGREILAERIDTNPLALEGGKPRSIGSAGAFGVSE